MKNREKYPNTNDALKAFKEHNEVCDCGCSFEEWLDKDVPSPIIGALTGFILGSLLRGNVALKDKPADKESEKRSNDDVLTGVECPICHGKHGNINSRLVSSFVCPDCNAYVGISSEVLDNRSIAFNREKFRSFIADLCKKNIRKD